MSFQQARDVKTRRGLPLHLTFERHDWSFAGEVGEAVEGRGYTLREGGRSLSWTSPRLAQAGVVVVKVAGTSYRLDELQDPAFAPGSVIKLRPEPENPHDPNAVGVWSANGAAQAGYVPRDSAGQLKELLGREELVSLALWEWRSADGRRYGLRILVAPPETLAERPAVISGPRARA